jgi:hypothetical protein
VGGAAEVLHPPRRVLQLARLAAAAGLEGGVEGEDDEARLGERLAIYRSGGLLLAAARIGGVRSAGLALQKMPNDRIASVCRKSGESLEHLAERTGVD